MKLKQPRPWVLTIPKSAKKNGTVYGNHHIVKQGKALWQRGNELESDEPFTIEYETAKGRRIRKEAKPR